MHKDNKNIDFMQQFLLFRVSLEHTVMIVPERTRVVLLMQTQVFWYSDYFINVFTIFVGLERLSWVAVYAGSEFFGDKLIF